MSVNTRTYEKGEFIFHDGDISKSMFLIQKGRVAILKPKGTSFIQLAEVHQGEMIGELAFFDPDRRPRSASAMAMTTVEVMEISYDSLQKTYEAVPDFMRKMFGSVVERIRKANDTIRKLQRDLVDAESFARKKSSDPSEAKAVELNDALAATADIDLCFGRKSPSDGGGTGKAS